MDDNIKWFQETRLNKVAKNLEKNNYEVYVLNTKKEALEKLENILIEGSTVSFGGSMTLDEIGAFNLLGNGKYNLLDRNKEGLSYEDIRLIYRNSFSCDYYITSSNAITENGELINLDGRGNRVAAMTYGPEKVIIVAGQNKIVKNIEEGYERIKNYASPINAKRLSKKTPCTITAKCEECSSEDRICNHLLVTYRQNLKGRCIVILVKENLGY